MSTRRGVMDRRRLRQEARAARAEIEAALDRAGSGSCWPWSRRLSRWIDLLAVLEEHS
jgi:hypothetical protein